MIKLLNFEVVALLSLLMAGAERRGVFEESKQSSSKEKGIHQQCGNIVGFQCTGGFSVPLRTAIVQMQHLLVNAKYLVSMGISTYSFLEKFKKYERERSK